MPKNINLHLSLLLTKEAGKVQEMALHTRNQKNCSGLRQGDTSFLFASAHAKGHMYNCWNKITFSMQQYN